MMVEKSPCDRVDIEIRFIITILLQHNATNYGEYKSLEFVLVYFTYVGAAEACSLAFLSSLCLDCTT